MPIAVISTPEVNKEALLLKTRFNQLEHSVVLLDLVPMDGSSFALPAQTTAILVLYSEKTWQIDRYLEALIEQRFVLAEAKKLLFLQINLETAVANPPVPPISRKGLNQLEDYWKSQYLELRKQKRRASPDVTNIDKKLRLARSFTTEIQLLEQPFEHAELLQWDLAKADQFSALLHQLGIQTFSPAPLPPPPARKSPSPNAFPFSAITNLRDFDEDGDEDDLIDSILDDLGMNAPKKQPPTAPAPSQLEGNFASLSSEAPKKVQQPVKNPPLPKEKLAMKDDTKSTSEKLDAYNDAQRSFKSQQIENGLHTLEAIIKEYPRDPALRVHYANALLQYRQALEPAAEHLRQALMLDSTFEDALFLQGELYEARDMPQQAMRYYKKLAEHNPDFPEVYARMAMLGANSLNAPHEEVIEWVNTAISKDDSSDPELLYLKAEALDSANDPEQAIEVLDELLEKDPEHPFAHYAMALIHYRKKDNASAKIAYEKAVEINPELKTPQNDLAFLTGPAVAKSTTDTAKDPAQKDTKLVDQTVFITGATSGIGKATAEVFAREGYRLVLTGRREERLQALKKALVETYGIAVKTLVFDVRHAEEAKKNVRKLRGAFANVDILINNAGLAKGLAPIHEGKIEHWETMIDTNLKGLLYMTRLIAPGMVRRKSGHIINIASTAGKEVYPQGNVYCATKFGVDALTKGMRLDLVEHNIRVSQVAPAHVEETEFALVRFDGNAGKAKIYDDFQPLKSSDVAETIYFIATRPAHVNIQDVVLMGTQQASSTVIDRSGRKF